MTNEQREFLLAKSRKYQELKNRLSSIIEKIKDRFVRWDTELKHVEYQIGHISNLLCEVYPPEEEDFLVDEQLGKREGGKGLFLTWNDERGWLHDRRDEEIIDWIYLDDLIDSLSKEK